MNNTEHALIIKFESLINKIIKLVKSYKITFSKILKLTNERIKILDINDHQEKDDIIFYTSVFDDTIYYLRKSLKIRKKKLKRDIIKNIKYLNTNVSNQLDIDNINKDECKSYFMKYINEKNKNKYKWVKNDRLKELNEWLKHFNNIIEYHEYIYEYLEKTVKINIEFFTNEQVDEDQDEDQDGEQDEEQDGGQDDRQDDEQDEQQDEELDE